MNNILKIITNQRAFTLVEAVVAISIVGVIGVIMSDILTRAFDNTRKTNLISNVQQNGQSVMSAFEDTIRYSEFVCVGGYSDSSLSTELAPNLALSYYSPVLVVFKEGKFIRYRIIPEIGNVNGYIAEDFPAPPIIDKTAIDLCKRPLTSVNLRKVTNDTINIGLSVKRGSITLLSNPVNNPNSGTSKVSLTVMFAIGSSVGSPVSPDNQIGENNEIVFQTTSQFR